MKKAICIILFCLFPASQTAYAHPPSGIKASFDTYTKTLEVTISHAVSNPANHYIKKVLILLNGNKVLEHQMSLQQTDNGQFVQYTIPDADTGDTIRIEAYCSSYGKRIKELKIR